MSVLLQSCSEANSPELSACILGCKSSRCQQSSLHVSITCNFISFVEISPRLPFAGVYANLDEKNALTLLEIYEVQKWKRAVPKEVIAAGSMLYVNVGKLATL